MSQIEINSSTATLLEKEVENFVTSLQTRTMKSGGAYNKYKSNSLQKSFANHVTPKIPHFTSKNSFLQWKESHKIIGYITNNSINTFKDSSNITMLSSDAYSGNRVSYLHQENLSTSPTRVLFHSNTSPSQTVHKSTLKTKVLENSSSKNNSPINDRNVVKVSEDRLKTSLRGSSSHYKPYQWFNGLDFQIFIQKYNLKSMIKS